MRIQTKINALILTVLLISTVLIGGTSFYFARESLIEAKGKELRAVMAGEKTNIIHILGAWKDRARLISSRTQLRRLLIEYGENPSEENHGEMRKILSDALKSTHAVKSIELCNIHDAPILNVGERILEDEALCNRFSEVSPEKAKIQNVWRDEIDDGFYALVTAPMQLDNQVIGYIYVTFNGMEVMEVVDNYERLAETGETVLIQKTPQDDVIFIPSLRHDPNDEFSRFIRDKEIQVPLNYATQDKEQFLDFRNIHYYRNHEFLATISYVPELGWGLVTKMNMTEAVAPVQRLLFVMTTSTLTVFLTMMFVGLYMGRSIVAPIVKLVNVSNAVKKGNIQVQAHISSHDEIEDLAASFNEMLDSLNKTNEELVESEKLFRSAMQYSAIGMALVALNGKWLKVNDALCKMLGYSKEELMAIDFQTITHPDDLNTDLQLLQKTLNGDISTYEMEKRYFHKSGDIIWILLSVALIRDKKGEPKFFVSQIQNITDRVEAESRIRESRNYLDAILNTVADGIISIDSNGTILTTNNAMEKLTGYEEDELVGHNIKILMSDTFYNRHAFGIKRYLGADEKRVIGSQGIELECRHKKGSYIPIEIGVGETNVGEEKIFVGILHDMTVRKKIENELRESNAELEEFAYRTSHDLCSPLVSSIGVLKVAQQLAQEGDPEQTIKAIQLVEASLKKLESLVKDILALTRAKNFKEEKEMIDVGYIIQESLDKMTHMNHFDRLDIKQNLGHIKNPVTLKSRITLIIENLLSNVIKYQDLNKETSFMKISTQQNKGQFILTVEDNGLGIPENKRDKLFSMFERFHPQTAFGSGLGLYMMKKSADIMGGEITYASTKDGSIFTLSIPQ